MKSADK